MSGSTVAQCVSESCRKMSFQVKICKFFSIFFKNNQIFCNLPKDSYVKAASRDGREVMELRQASLVW